MLRRFDLRALTAGLLFVGASTAAAQTPQLHPLPSPVPQASQSTAHWIAEPQVFEPMAESIDPIAPATYSTNCNFDPYAHYDEARARSKRKPLGPKSFRRTTYRWEEDCDDCAESDPDYCDFTCANCYARFDFEKRIILSYAHGNAHKRATRFAYGDDHSGQLAVELMPFVLREDYSAYTRWGGTFMFNYSDYEGNRAASLRSIASGNVLTVDDGRTYSFIVGPTLRTDFQIFGLRLSPNGTVGATFDWTNLRTIAPQAADTRRVSSFKQSGFDVGFYTRLMLDFPITKKFNIGVGGEFKLVPTDVMTFDDEDARKHLGVVVSISHEF